MAASFLPNKETAQSKRLKSTDKKVAESRLESREKADTGKRATNHSDIRSSRKWL